VNSFSILPRTRLGQAGPACAVIGIISHIVLQSRITSHQASQLEDLIGGSFTIAAYVVSIAISAIALSARRDRSLLAAFPVIGAFLFLVFAVWAFIVGIP
jgi:predicted MFS family arabinose efflux permease